jgi:hypothetical protein
MNKKEVSLWVGQCLRKVKLSERDANRIINRAQLNDHKMFKYFCPHCGNWHVTKKLLDAQDTPK